MLLSAQSAAPTMSSTTRRPRRGRPLCLNRDRLNRGSTILIKLVY